MIIVGHGGQEKYQSTIRLQQIPPKKYEICNKDREFIRFCWRNVRLIIPDNIFDPLACTRTKHRRTGEDVFGAPDMQHAVQDLTLFFYQGALLPRGLHLRQCVQPE